MGSRMSSHPNHLPLVILCVVLAAGPSVPGQTERPQTSEDATTIRSRIADALNRRLLSEDRDELYILAIQHSKIMVSELVSRMEAQLADGASDGKLVARLSDILAYAGDETAVDALSRLCAQHQAPFGYYIERTLDYAGSRRNPYTLAYYTLEKGNAEVVPYVMSWVRASLPVPHFRRAWARALFDRYKGIPPESDLPKDPIVSRLSDGLPPEVRNELVAVARDAAKSDDRR